MMHQTFYVCMFVIPHLFTVYTKCHQSNIIYGYVLIMYSHKYFLNLLFFLFLLLGRSSYCAAHEFFVEMSTRDLSQKVQFFKLEGPNCTSNQETVWRVVVEALITFAHNGLSLGCVLAPPARPACLAAVMANCMLVFNIVN